MKKFLSLLLCIILMVQTVPLAFAQSNAEVMLTSASAMCGENVTITVSVNNCVEAKSIYIAPQYDDEVLEIVSGTWLVSGMLADDWSAEFGDAAIAFSANADVNTDIFEFVFKVKDNAQAGVVTNVSCEIVIKTTEGKDEVPVTVTITEGHVTVLAKQCSHTDKTEGPSKSADCVHPGNHLYYTCDSCGAVLKADGVTETTVEAETIPALGHDLSNATCTEAAKCQREGCGYTEGSALGHSFTNYMSNGDASCTGDGTKTAKCDRCDVTDTITDAGSAKGHDYAAATCTTPKTCKVCGATEGEALGHSYASTWSKGEGGHWHECAACGDKTDFAAHDYGTAGDECIICDYERVHVHRLTLVPAKDATCTEDGNKAYYICSGCENWFEDASGAVVISDKSSVVLSALGHDYADATCTTPKTCRVCGAKEGDALGHSFTNYVSNGDATCTEDGTKIAKCDRCDVTDTIADAGSAKGHDYADATCTTPKTCRVCGAKEGDALGHSFTNYVSNGDATCTEDGTKTAKCDRCDATDTIADVGSAKGHSYATTWSKGEDGHWHECSACGDKTDFAAHDYGTEGDICIVCEYARDHVHRLTLVPAVDASCTTDGNGAYYTCSDCENWFEDASGSIVISDKTSVVVAALGHSFTNYMSNGDATCTEDGTKTVKCDRCDMTDTITDVGSAKGHDYADATCTTPKICKVCGATEGEALGHSYASIWSKGEDGHWHECAACGDKTDLASHDYGTEGDNCIICEYERAHVHRLTLVPATDATCTEDGSKAHYICSGCEDWFEDASGTAVISDKTCVVIAAMGHDMLDATCTEAAHCQREGCDYAEGSALGHIDENADGKCDRCGIALEADPPTTPDKPTNDVPKTGDNSNIMLWVTLLILSFAGMMICAEFGRKRNAA